MGDTNGADDGSGIERETLSLQNEIKDKLKHARSEDDLRALEPRIRELQALIAKRFALATAPMKPHLGEAERTDADTPKQ